MIFEKQVFVPNFLFDCQFLVVLFLNIQNSIDSMDDFAANLNNIKSLYISAYIVIIFSISPSRVLKWCIVSMYTITV